MTTRPTHYTNARVGCYFLLGLVFLSLHGVSATSDSTHEAKQVLLLRKSSSESDGSRRDNLTLNTQSSNDNGTYRHVSEAYKLTQAIMKDANTVAHRRRHTNPVAAYALLHDLLRQAKEGKPERFCHALSIRNLNSIYDFHDTLLYRIIVNYLTLVEVPDQYKQQLKANIKASKIMPAPGCSSRTSLAKQWTCCVSAGCGLSGVCFQYCLSNAIVSGSLCGLSCLACCIFSCMRCTLSEREWMRLIQHVIEDEENLQYNQRLAMCIGKI